MERERESGAKRKSVEYTPVSGRGQAELKNEIWGEIFARIQRKHETGKSRYACRYMVGTEKFEHKSLFESNSQSTFVN